MSQDAARLQAAAPNSAAVSLDSSSQAGTHELQPLPPDLTAPQFTLRAVLTGMVLGGLFSVCNVYAGLKIGLAFNMSIPAVVLSYGAWSLLHVASGRRVRPLGILENNISQTGCSAGALVASAGLTAPIPALAIMTGQTLPWHTLALWVFSVCLVGIVVGIGLRRQMLLVDKLPFAVGIASAETLREMYARGREALARVLVLIGGALLAAALKLGEFVGSWGVLAIPGRIKGFTFQSLTFGFEPTLLLYGVGGLIGLRTGVSLLIGAILAWGAIAPPLLHSGYMRQPNFTEMRQWTIWPGVTLMVVASLVSFSFSWRSIGAALTRKRGGSPGTGRSFFVGALLAALALSVWLQMSLFGIVAWAAVASVLLSFALALVGARVSGETGITPVGQMGKISQVVFGALIPQSPAPNLMAANVTGGAASQCADLLHDYKCGYLIGASPRWQTLAQIGGAMAGALVASAAYLALVRNPAEQLLTTSLPAPGVAGMKAVADLFQVGFRALPGGSGIAMLIAAAVGIVLPIVEHLAPPPVRRWLPSAASIGLAFVFPASVSVALFVGGLVAFLLGKCCPSWTSRFLLPICAGMIAGESITGVGTALYTMGKS